MGRGGAAEREEERTGRERVFWFHEEREGERVIKKQTREESETERVKEGRSKRRQNALPRARGQILILSSPISTNTHTLFHSVRIHVCCCPLYIHIHLPACLFGPE